MFVCFSRWTAKIFKIAVKIFDMNHWSMDFQVEVSDSMFPRRQLTWLSFYILEHCLLVCSTDSSCPGCYCCTWTDSYFNTCSLLLCFFDMSALAIRLWYPWEQGPCFFTLCIFCIWNTTGNMIDIREGSLIQFIFCNHYVAKYSHFNMVLVEYMLSRHHIYGFSVSGVSETFEGSCKMFKMRIITHISMSYHTVANTILRLPQYIGQYFVESVLCVTTSVFLYCCYFAEILFKNITCYKTNHKINTMNTIILWIFIKINFKMIYKWYI